MNEPLQSKINYTAVLISLVTLVLIGIDASAETKAEVLTITTLVGPPMIVTFRTWFTNRKSK